MHRTPYRQRPPPVPHSTNHTSPRPQTAVCRHAVALLQTRCAETPADQNRTRALGASSCTPCDVRYSVFTLYSHGLDDGNQSGAKSTKPSPLARFRMAPARYSCTISDMHQSAQTVRKGVIAPMYRARIFVEPIIMHNDTPPYQEHSVLRYLRTSTLTRIVLVVRPPSPPAAAHGTSNSLNAFNFLAGAGSTQAQLLEAAWHRMP